MLRSRVGSGGFFEIDFVDFNFFVDEFIDIDYNLKIIDIYKNKVRVNILVYVIICFGSRVRVNDDFFFVFVGCELVGVVCYKYVYVELFLKYGKRV